MAKKKAEEVKEEEKQVINEEIIAETIDDVVEEVVVETSKEDDLVEEINNLKQELASLKDSTLREKAETENYRKRILRDKEDAVKYANSALVKDLLGPIDDFSRAIDAAEKSENFDALKEGVKMIEDRIYSLLKNNWGLSIIDSIDVPFDPNEHEACLLEEVEGLEEDTVTMLLQKGYKLNGRVIRSAKVKVGKSIK